MLKITLYQMRRNIGRLIAAGIAIAIGTAFVAATFVGGQVLIKTSEASLTANLADAALTSNANYRTSGSDGSEEWVTKLFTPEEVTQIAALPGVAEVNLTGEYDTVTISAGEKTEFIGVALSAEHPDLQLVNIIDGKAPASSSEVALPQKSVDRLNLDLGDSVAALATDYEAYDAALGEGLSSEEASAAATTKIDLTLTGATDDFRGAYSSTSGAALLTQAGWEAISQAVEQTPQFLAGRVLVAADDNTDLLALQEAMGKITGERPAYTPKEVAENTFYDLTGDANIVMTFVLVFAALALFVAGLVITNTFQVLVAQRARTLALLRCVGANKKQIRNSVLVEAAILGFLSSVAGIIIGLSLMQATVSIISRFDFARGVPSVISVPATAIWVPLVAGTVVTILASLVPARLATKVPPLAALRPQESSGEASKKAGTVRLVFALLLIVSGAGLILWGLTMGAGDESGLELSLVAGILGGMLTFVGLIVSSVVWVPRVVGVFGKLTSVGPATALASANTTRNPRRTAATATALFIGVTLVAMMSVGAATARETFNSMLDDKYPIDIMGQTGWGAAGQQEITSEVLDRVTAIDGVEAAAVVNTLSSPGINVTPQPDAAGSVQGGEMNYGVIALSKDDIAKVLRTPELGDLLTDSTTILSGWAGGDLDGATVRFYDSSVGSDEEWTEESADRPGYADGFDLTAIATPNAVEQWIITPANLDKILELMGPQGEPVSASLIIKVEDINNAGSVVDGLRDVFGEDSLYFTGAVMERLQFQQMIDVILLVLVGLLAVAVVIALIGVANTLSLSVIERRRESATLRAIGMSKKQLKRSLGAEGMLIAGIGALLGVGLGILYAYIGTTLLLGGFADVQLSIRWIDVAMILGIALAAGLLASVIPARGAANTSPVEALAME